jgi:hypothetical protein
MALSIHESPQAHGSTWAVRVALFSGGIVFVAILMHRLLGMATPVALNLFGVALGGALLALVLGVVALADVWRRGAQGMASALGGMAIGVGLIAWPAAYVPTAMTLPEINDITTDTARPPGFINLAVLRGAGTNGTAYHADRFPDLQKKAFPDIRTLIIPRPVEEGFDIAVEAIQKLKFDMVADDPPDRRTGKAGRIEAVDRTLVIGFYDDVSIRVEGDQTQTRVDVRSASRYGLHDLGRNAQRVRRVLNQLQASYEASVPGGPGERLGRGKRIAKAVPKRGKAPDQKSAPRRK